MSKIVVWGTSFAKIGDEAQLIASIDLLNTLIDSAEITVLDQPRPQIARFHPQVRTQQLMRFWRSLPLLAKADLLLVVGAPFYATQKQLLAITVVLGCAKLFRVPIAAYGITVFDPGNSWYGRFFRRIFNQFAMLGTREESGVKRLRELSVSVPVCHVEDQRVLLQASPSTEVNALLQQSGIDPERPIIGITTRLIHAEVPDWVKQLQGFDAARHANAMTTFGKLCGALAELAQLIVIPMHPDIADDQAIVDQMRSFVQDPDRVRLLSTPFSARQCLGVIERCDLLLSSRLSSTSFAINSGTPVVGLAFDSRALEAMAKVGTGTQAFLWNDLDYDDVWNACRELWDDRDGMRDLMKSHTTARRNQVLRDATPIRALLASG